MEEIKLLMTFENAAGDRTTIKIGGARSNISKEEAETLGNYIVEKAIFSYKNANLTRYVSSKIETTYTEDL